MKKLIEKRNALLDEMDSLLKLVETETRAFTNEEQQKYDDLKSEIDSINKTISAAEESREYTKIENTANGKDENTEKAEERAFENYVRGRIIEERDSTPQNLTMGNNGAVIPTTIANRIINKVKDICPIFAKATIYNVKGTLKIPVWGSAKDSDGNEHNITVGYQSEFTELTADTGRFTSIDLNGYLTGALTLIGKSVINNAQVDVVSFIVNEMSKEIAYWLENQLLNATGKQSDGSTPCATGVLSATNITTSGASITTDKLIELQASIKQIYQTNACWTMHPDTFVAIKKLKDGNGRYLIQDDFTSEMPYRILGKPVYLSDNMPKVESGSKPILYGDYSGLAVNMRENMSIEVLREKYATMHAIGITAWFEFDSKVIDNQKLAVLEISTT